MNAFLEFLEGNIKYAPGVGVNSMKNIEGGLVELSGTQFQHFLGELDDTLLGILLKEIHVDVFRQVLKDGKPHASVKSADDPDRFPHLSQFPVTQLCYPLAVRPPTMIHIIRSCILSQGLDRHTLGPAWVIR